ncbi:hypothetical protein ACKF11_13335 [Methylobacillus sp. Pita2]|uniref:hypothetical protein n=1 Tax=Methylobacillus sp. Pita2 TaxID=3383245 RepID=UPI0038B4C26C
MMTVPYQDVVVEFLKQVGLDIREIPVANGFVPHIEIHGGVIYYDRNVSASALLHEAGHLAILTGDARAHCETDVSGAQRLMFEHYRDLEHDHPALRIALQSGDTEATAWAWAAGKHLGVPDDLIILDHEYDGTGTEIRLRLQLNAYFGINGLRATGICKTGQDGYPKLNYWLQPGFDIIPAPEAKRSPGMH